MPCPLRFNPPPKSDSMPHAAVAPAAARSASALRAQALAALSACRPSPSPPPTRSPSSRCAGTRACPFWAGRPPSRASCSARPPTRMPTPCSTCLQRSAAGRRAPPAQGEAEGEAVTGKGRGDCAGALLGYPACCTPRWPLCGRPSHDASLRAPAHPSPTPDPPTPLVPPAAYPGLLPL